MTMRPAMDAVGQAARWTGMPSWVALSTRLSVMPEPGKAMTPLGSRFSSSSLRRNGGRRAAVGVPVGLADDLVHAPRLRPARGDVFRARTAAVHKHHVRVLGSDLIECVADPVGVLDGLGAGDCHQRPLRQVRLGLLGLSGAEEVPGVDRGGGQLRRAGSVRSVPRPPGVAGVGQIALGRCVPQPLERVPPVAEVLRALDDSLQFPGVDLGPVLRLLKFLQFRREPIDCPVQPHRLHVQGVDEAPEQRLAFVGKLGPVGRDLLDERIQNGLKARQGFGLVPDGSGIGLASCGSAAKAFEILADDRGRRRVLSVSKHDELLSFL